MDSYNLAKSTLDWNVNTELVFHERAKRNKDEPYISRIRELKSNKLHLSLNPVPYNQLDELIQSCDIGLVIYNPSEYGSSWQNIAKASGKLADYLAFGKPVICSNLNDLRELIRKYECGFTFDELSEIPALVSKVNKNYKFYRSNALKCFSKEFEFSKFFNPFLLILCSRNDSYMRNSRWRLETSINLAVLNAKDANFLDKLEIIVTDWGSEVPLSEVLSLVPEAKGKVKFVHVPPDIAEVEQKDSKFPEVIALNSAARRASGEYIGRIDNDTVVGADFFRRFEQLNKNNPTDELDLANSFLFVERKSIPYRISRLSLTLNR